MTTSTPSEPPAPAWGRLIEAARDAQRIPQRAAARKAGIGRQTWIDAARGYKLRDGQVEPVTPEARTIARMAAAVSLAPERLAGEGEHPGAAEILREILGAPAAPLLSPVSDAPPFPVEPNGDPVIAALINRWPVRDGTHLTMRLIWSTDDAALEDRRQALAGLLAPLAVEAGEDAEVRENGDAVIAALIAAWPEEAARRGMRLIWNLPTGERTESRRRSIHGRLYEGDPRASNAPWGSVAVEDEDRQTS